MVNLQWSMLNEMKQFISFVIKEARHILRDKRTMLILFGMPVVMMLLFGFAITTDVKNVRTVVVTSQMDHLTQAAVARLAQSEYFTITQTVSTPQEAERLIRSQKADMAMVFTHDFASKKDGIQLIVDGSDPNMAQQWTNYAQGVLARSAEGRLQGKDMQGSVVNSKMLYNPQMKSSAARLARTSTDGHHRQGRTLSGTCFRHPHHHPLNGPLRARCAAARLHSMDSRRLHPIYIISTIAGPAHLERGTDPARCFAALSYGAAHACGDALRHVIPCGIDAHRAAMDCRCCAAALLHRGHAQADDYGCGHR